LNVAALVVAKTKAGERDCVQSQSASCGPDYGPSIFLFVYVGWLVWVLIWSIQARWFPDPTNESSAYEFLRHPNDQQRLQISMTMRTELILRALDLMTDFVFFWDGTHPLMRAAGSLPCALLTPTPYAWPLPKSCAMQRKTWIPRLILNGQTEESLLPQYSQRTCWPCACCCIIFALTRPFIPSS
jgi:hypothetical protein